MKIEKDRVVTFHYALVSGEGEVIDGTKGGDPIPYLHGHNNIVSGLEAALDGHEAGEQVRVTLAPEQAYGERDEEKVFDVERQLFANVPELAVGFMCHMTNEQGVEELVSVVEIADDVVTVDANHPYAGETLTFEVDLLEVRTATADEIKAGSLI